MELLFLFVGYFFYESDASWVWWIGYWAILVLRVYKAVHDYRKQNDKEIEEQRIYWEGNDREGF